MRFLSVCSGIEAASTAWAPLGWKAVAFSEIEPFPCAVLAHHYPDVPNWGDMTKFKDWPDAAIDLLCGGTPCQSFSIAGLRKGLDDPRGNLMLTFGAIAAKYRPRWLVWENVPGVLSSNGGRDFGAFLGMLGQLGYGFAYRVLDAQYFGVAQRRRRVFVVGCLGDWRSAAAVLFERHSLSGHPAPSREAGEVTAPCVTAGASNGGAAHGARSGSAKEGLIIPHVPELAACLTRGTGLRYDTDTDTILPVAGAICRDSFVGGMGGRPEGAAVGHVVPVAFPANLSGTQHASTENLAPAMGAKNPTAVAHPVLSFKAGQSEAAGGTFVTEEYAPTLQAANNGSTAVPAIQAAMQVRRLTPTECERLQGFSDNYTRIPWRGKPADQCPDGPRYKALGNSWAVPCAVWIGERIAAVDAIAHERQIYGRAAA